MLYLVNSKKNSTFAGSILCMKRIRYVYCACENKSTTCSFCKEKPKKGK